MCARSRRVIAAGLFLFGLSACATAQTAVVPPPAATPAGSPPPSVAAVSSITADRFSFRDAYVVLQPPGTTHGEARVIVSAEKLSKDPLAAEKIEVSDIRISETSDPTQVEFNVEAELQRSAEGRQWVVKADVSNMAVNSEQPRYARIKLGSVVQAVPYVLTNKPQVVPDFTVAVNSPWILSGSNDDGTVVISTGQQPISGLRLANSTLVEKTMGTPIRVQHLELCRSTAAACEAPTPIPAVTSETLYLRVLETQRVPGRYTGALAFAVDNRPEPKSLSLEVYSSSNCARVLGAILIATGVVLAWQLTVWGRARFDRLSALKLATAARLRIEDLLVRLNEARTVTGIDFAQLRKVYAEKAERLTELALDREHRLPPRWPAFWQSDMPDLKSHLLAMEEPIAGLAVLVRDGVETLIPRWRLALDANAKRKVEEGLLHLDAPSEIDSEAKARARVAAAISMALPPPQDVAAGMQSASPSAALLLERISSQIEALSKGVWIAYLILVSIAGFALIILNNPGFGTAMDYVYCLFWGFGLPVTLDKLQQISPVGVSTSLGITLPK